MEDDAIIKDGYGCCLIALAVNVIKELAQEIGDRKLERMADRIAAHAGLVKTK